MACRLFNSSAHPLRIDLRGGETLHLAPGATSGPLREELLYDNQFVSSWERTGMLARLPARFEEVQQHETQQTEAKQAKPVPDKKARKAKERAEPKEHHKERTEHKHHKEGKKTSGEDAA